MNSFLGNIILFPYQLALLLCRKSLDILKVFFKLLQIVFVLSFIILYQILLIINFCLLSFRYNISSLFISKSNDFIDLKHLFNSAIGIALHIVCLAINSGLMHTSHLPERSFDINIPYLFLCLLLLLSLYYPFDIKY